MEEEESNDGDSVKETDEPLLSSMEDFMNCIWGQPRAWAKTFSESLQDREEDSYVFKSFQNCFEKDYLFDEALKNKIVNGEYDIEREREKLRTEFSKKNPAYNLQYYLPFQSALTRNEMQFCYYVFLELSNGKKVPENKLQKYLEFKTKIDEEQGEFIQKVREHWVNNNHSHKFNVIKPEVIEYTTQFWKDRLKRISWYPKFYSNCANVPLIDETERASELKFESNTFSIGYSPWMNLPSLQKNQLNIYSDQAGVYNQTDFRTVKFSYKPIHISMFKKDYHPEVSRDKIAESLAAKHDAHVVMSASSFLCLFNNHKDTTNPSWDVPITIKEDAETHKKVIYLDKKLPPNTLPIVERNRLYCKKKILNVLGGTGKKTDRIPRKRFDYDAVDSDTEIPFPTKLTRSAESSPSELSSRFVKSDYTAVENKSLDSDLSAEEAGASESDAELKIDSDEPRCSEECPKDKELKRPTAYPKYPPARICYNLWKMRCETQSVLLKTNLKDLNLLIRCKSTSKKNSGSKIIDHVVSTKLEYQPLFGAEVPSIREISCDWCNTLIRPDSSLMRVRLDPHSGNLIMYEKKSLHDLSMDFRRLYGSDPRTKLTSVHGILDLIVRQPPGRYVLSHGVQSGLFATLYKEDERNHSFNFNLKYVNINCNDMPPLNCGYLPIDRTVLTPVCHGWKKLPATFNKPAKAKFSSALDSSLQKVKKTVPVKNKKAKKKKKKAGGNS